MTTRINARLDDALARQLDEIRRITGQTLTEVLEEALLAYCRDVGHLTRRPYDAFAAAGFIGAGKGPKHLARDYKKHLSASLRRKT